MQNLDAAIRDYYTPPCDSFWLWQDHGESIAWKDGKTITFGEELTAILKHTAPHGLPRLGALLMLIAATRANWAADGSEAGLLSGMIASRPTTDEAITAEDAELLQRTLSGLHRIRALDSSLRTSLEAKMAMVELVFEGQRPIVAKEAAQAVADAIRPGLMARIESVPEFASVGYGPLLMLQDLAALASGLEKVHAESVRLRLKIGFDALPTRARIEVPPEQLSPCETARGFIEELLDSAEYRGLAQVAKQLLANTTLPRKLTESQEQELGGFSDIANRGTPDRLLLSELAQDGLTLAVRVAMNEAMYLHRETPPSTPRFRRELLIDSGVRAWGTPRVFAAAVALAFAATTPRSSSLGIWRGSGGSLCEVDLSTKEGLTEHLAALEPDPHLADALPEFTRRLEASDEPIEAVLLMPDDALTDPTFMQSLRSLTVDRLYIATVSRTGAFQLSERRPRGEKLMRQAQIDMDHLFDGDSQLIEKIDLERRPAIVRVEPFPLRLPHTLAPERSWSIGNWGSLSITGDGRLMRWTEPSKGGEQLSEQLPKGKLWWASPHCMQGVTDFVYGPVSKPIWFRVDLTHGEVEGTSLECGAISNIAFHNGVLFCFGIRSSRVKEVDVGTGEVVRELVVPSSLRWARDRFFVDGRGVWYALSHDGQAGTIDALPDFDTARDPVVCVWDAVGFEGPLALTTNGRLLGDDSEQGRIPKCKDAIRDCQVEWVSPDGLVIHGTCDQSRSGSTLDAFQIRLNLRPTFELTYRDRIGFLEHRIRAIVRPGNIRNKFRSIGVTETGKLTLTSTKGQQVSITSRLGMPLFTVLEQTSKLSHEQMFALSETDDIRYKLSLATWWDGSQAVLDSRGLLHLKPANLTTPEVTLVLAEGELTGWCNDGRTFGKPFFLSDSDHYLKRAPGRRKLCEETIAKFVEGIRATG